jgi:hypothetical protein
MATIPLPPGLNRVQTEVDIASLRRPARLHFLLFGKHLEQAAYVGLFHELRVVKERLPSALGRSGTRLDCIVFCSPTQEQMQAGETRTHFAAPTLISSP